MLAVSDSNYNRILVVDAEESGKVVHKIGDRAKDLRDGNFAEARFFRPQGVLWIGEKIYVADTENRAVREIDLQSKMVRTLAGNGRQGYWLQSPQDGKATQLSSPWDLAHDGGGFIFIAMAGLHQIWAYHIRSGKIARLRAVATKTSSTTSSEKRSLRSQAGYRYLQTTSLWQTAKCRQ